MTTSLALLPEFSGLRAGRGTTTQKPSSGAGPGAYMVVIGAGCLCPGILTQSPGRYGWP